MPRLTAPPQARLERLDEHTRKRGSVYVGTAGVALLLLRLAAADARPHNHSEEALLARALELAELAEERANPGWVSFLEGLPGVLAVQCALLAAAGRGDDALAAARRVAQYENMVLALPPGECELLYGRAGFLHACLFARAHVPAAAPLIDDVMLRVAGQARRRRHRPRSHGRTSSAVLRRRAAGGG